jgi:phosphate transport system permease protein
MSIDRRTIFSAIRSPLRLGKKRRVVELIIESIIRVFSFVSIAAIVLIFIFVFREASPILFGTSESHHTTEAVSGSSGSSIEQEVYDPLAEDKPAEKRSDLEQEVYDPLGDSAVTSAQTLGTTKEVSSSEEASLDSARREAAKITTMFTSTTWQPVSDVPKYGFVPLFFGSLKTTLIALLFAAPLAILAALYTSTFAPRRLREVIKPTIELLAGFPSVVIGFFALIVMATYFQDIFGYTYRLNSFVGGIAMGLAVIPIIYTISEDALTAVPQPLRDASTALGATKWQTAVRVVLPAAIPGVFASLILGFGRAFGETMIALMATGNAAMTSADPFEPVRTFAATIGAEMAEVVFGDEHYNVLFLIGAMLFVFTFVMNSIVEFYIRKRLIKRIQGR